MKNALKYYYNYEPIDIHFKNNNYFFSVSNQFYVLYLCNLEDNDIQQIYELQLNFLKNNIYTHQIILNIEQKVFTIIDNKKYVLMKMYNEMIDKVTKRMLLLFTEETSYILKNYTNKISWKDLWKQKIDYFEYQLNEFGKKFTNLRKCFNYFVGMVEVGISLLSNINNDANISISHRRINKDSTTFDLYNPFNFIIDYKIRDICEYFKYNFIKGEDVFNEIKEYLSTTNLNIDDSYLFFVRMLFPSFYFDSYEKIMNKYFYEDIIEENVLNNIEEIALKYEKLLKKIYSFMKEYILIPRIDWFEN